MLYILECMFYGLTCLHGGNNKPLQSTGEALTRKDAGVCMLGWAIVVMLIFLIAYIINYLAHRNKADVNKDIKLNENNSKNLVLRKGFFNGLIYLAECIALVFLIMLGGTNRTLYSTGKRATKKEVAYCVIGWMYIFLIVVAIVLICI